MKHLLNSIAVIVIMMFLPNVAFAQFSPGDLTKAHEEFEGIRNCTKCHTIGEKITEAKCLTCHEEIANLIELERGYHAADEVTEKTCFDCHSEHHGRSFDIIRLEEDTFEHELSGYALVGAHEKVDCRDCHSPENILSDKLKANIDTWLGMEISCLSCHDDEHQGTLGEDCLDCHDNQSFEGASRFNHTDTDFPLKGAHRKVACSQCHMSKQRNGHTFTVFAEVRHGRCTDCHKDEHDEQFGPNCMDCHGQNSWLDLKNENKFDHSLTVFPLEGQHQGLSCDLCHKGDRLSEPILHEQCLDCHVDFHEGQLLDNHDVIRDCDECHNVAQAFSVFRFGLKEHQATAFPLKGAHIATPCFSCHQSDDESPWDFNVPSASCSDCHNSPHGAQFDLSEKANCRSCHSNESVWSASLFNHDSTQFPLTGKHQYVDCDDCHQPYLESPKVIQYKIQRFDCIDCHGDLAN